MSNIRDRLQSRLTELNEEKERRKQEAEKEDKSILGTIGGGLQLLGQATLKSLEGTFIDAPLWVAANIKNLFGDEEGANTFGEAANISLTDMLINKAAGKETNPYLNNNTNLWNKENLNKTSYITDENFAGKVISAAGEMLPTIALGGMGGSGTAKVMLGTKAFSSGANQAFDEGASVGQATLYGAANTGIELLTEKISGGIPGLKKIEGTTTYDLLKNYTKDIIGEGVEEIVAELANPAAQALTYKGGDALQQYASSEYWKGVLEAGLIGSLTGAVLDSPSVVKGSQTSTNVQPSDTQVQTQSDTQTTTPQLPNVKEVPTTSPVQQTSTAITEDVKSVPTKQIDTIIDDTGKVKTSEIKTQEKPVVQENRQSLNKQPVKTQEKPMSTAELLKSDIKSVKANTINNTKVSKNVTNKQSGTMVQNTNVSETQVETKQETKKPTITPVELTNQFKSIEDSYAKANKYTGEIKADLLQTTQKDYNKYRDAGGDKTISVLEENYQAKQKMVSALNKNTISETKYTPAQANVYRMKSESSISKYQKLIDSKSTNANKLAEMKKIVDEYNKNVSKGMEPIEQYEKWKNEVELHESSNKTINNEPTESFKEIEKEVIEEVKVVTEESVTGDGVVDEIIEIDDIEILDIELDDIIDETELTEPRVNSKINTVYNEQQKKLATKNNTAVEDTALQKIEDALKKKDILDKKYNEQGNIGIIQKFLDQYASLRRIDKANKNNKIINAMRQKNKAGVLANQTINGDNLIDINFNPTDIPSVKKALQPILDLSTDTQNIAQTYILLQMDYFNKINSELYDIDYVDNIFPEYDTDRIVEEVVKIENTCPELVNLIKTNIMPNIRKITNKINEMEISTNVRNANTQVTKDFAKNEMGMSDEEIKAHTKRGKIYVDTVDFFTAANPWYIPISREVVKTGKGASSKVEAGIAKPKTRQEGAEQYNIQNIADGMAEKVMSSYMNMKNNQLRQAIAEGWSNITENKIIEYTTKTGETEHITISGDGTIQMSYLANDAKGNLVRKSVNITKNMADAYNGIDDSIKAFKETKLGKALGVKARIQKNLLTKYNIPWQVKNVFMDSFDAILNNEFNLKGNVDFLKNEAGAFIKDAANNTTTYQEFMAYRGEYLTQTEQKGYIRNETNLQKTVGKLDNMLEFGELMTRYALYKTARESGLDISESQRISDEGTTDFTKTGSFFKMLDSTGATVFLSANVAGINRFIDTSITPYLNSFKAINNQMKQGGIKQALNKQSYDVNDIKTMKRATTQLIKTSLIFGLGRELLKNLFDDEESQEMINNLSDTEIQNNIIIPTQGGVIKIPKGRIWRAYDAIADVISDSTIRDEDKMDLVETLSYVWDSVGVSSIDSSTTASNLMSILKNEDYYGNEIYSESAISKETFDYLLKQYGSVYYKTFKYVNGGTEINPWLSTFYTDTNTVSSYNNRFYNMKDAYSNIYDKSSGKFNSDEDMQNYFAYRVINYEKSNGELSVELSKLKAMKEDSTYSSDEIRKQEAKIQAIYQDIFSYIDNNEAKDYSISQNGSIIKYGTKYRFTKNSEGSYVKDRK